MRSLVTVLDLPQVCTLSPGEPTVYTMSSFNKRKSTPNSANSFTLFAIYNKQRQLPWHFAQRRTLCKKLNMHRPATLSPVTSVLLNACLQSACLMLSSKLGWLYSAAKPPCIASLQTRTIVKRKIGLQPRVTSKHDAFRSKLAFFPPPLLPQLSSCGNGRTVLKAHETGTTFYEETLHNPSMLYLGSRVFGGAFSNGVQPEMPHYRQRRLKKPSYPPGNACHGKDKNLQPLKKQQQKCWNMTRFVQFAALLQSQSDEQRQNKQL